MQREGRSTEITGTPSVDTPKDLEKSSFESMELLVEDCSIPFMLLIALPRFAIMMAWAAQWAVLGPLLEILLSSSAVQLIQLIGPLCGLLIVPTLGVFSDTCTNRFGRRRPFLFVGSVTSMLAYILLMFATELGTGFGDTSSSRYWTTVIVILCYVWTDISLNVAMVPITLLMADMAGHRQVTGSVVTGIFSSAGLMTTAVYIAMFGPVHQDIKPFMCILISILGVTSSITCYFVREKKLVTEPSKRRVKEALMAVFTGIRQLPSPLGVYFILILLTTYGFTSYNGAKGQFFGLVVKGGDSKDADLCGKLTTLPCSVGQDAFNDGVRLAGLADTLQAVAFFYVLGLPWLVRRFGAKIMIVVSIIPQIFFVVMSFSRNIPLDISIAVAISITQATMNLLIVPLVIHVVGHGEDNSLGLYNGALNSALCGGQFLNYIFSAILVTTSMGYALPILVGGVMSLLAFLIACFKFHITMHSM